MTPSEHFAFASKLMDRVAGLDAPLPIARALTSQAHVHAILALYRPRRDDHTFRDGYTAGREPRLARTRDEYL